MFRRSTTYEVICGRPTRPKKGGCEKNILYVVENYNEMNLDVEKKWSWVPLQFQENLVYFIVLIYYNTKTRPTQILKTKYFIYFGFFCCSTYINFHVKLGKYIYLRFWFDFYKI